MPRGKSITDALDLDGGEWSDRPPRGLLRAHTNEQASRKLGVLSIF